MIIIIQSQLIRIGQLVQLNSIRPLLFFLLFLNHQLSLSLFLHLLGQLYQWVTSPNTTAACLFVIATVAVISTEASDVLPATPLEPDKPTLMSAAGTLEHQLIGV